MRQAWLLMCTIVDVVYKRLFMPSFIYLEFQINDHKRYKVPELHFQGYSNV